MGMFDYIKGTMKCPRCNSIINIEEQIKWRDYEDRDLSTFTIGDYIGVPDGIYRHGSGCRGWLDATCNNCNEYYSYEVIIKDGIMKDIRPIEKIHKNTSKFISQINNDIYIDGKLTPSVPGMKNSSRVVNINGKVYVNGYEWTGTNWKRSLKAILYDIFY